MDDATYLPPPPSLDPARALFLDVDGTLIGFSERPDQVRLSPTVRADIHAIGERLGGAVALVSGRPIVQLDRLFAPLRLPAAGLHGHELRGAAQAQVVGAGSANTAGLSPHLHRRAAQLAQNHPGVLIEDKGVSLALHWRSAPQAAATVLAFAHAQLHDLPGYRLQPGDHVVEFVPEGSDKGRAIERLLRQPGFAGRRPVFVGDDLTDEFGFAAANRLDGWSVLVGQRSGTQARYALADIAAVHAWLHDNARP